MILTMMTMLMMMIQVVVTAITANAIDAVCKLTGYLLTGSHSLFAEFIHSCADTGNQIVVYVGIRNSAHRPDSRHPYGIPPLLTILPFS